MRHEAAFQIDFDLADVQDLPRIGSGAAQNGPDPRHQFARPEGLHDVVVGADFEQQHLVDLVSHGAEDDDGSSHAGGAQLLADLDPAHARQPEIDQDEIGLKHQRLLESGPAFGREHGLEAFLFQHQRDCVAEVLVVIDDENLLGAWRLNHPDRPLTREMILNSVWGYSFASNTRTVDAHILKLRQKLEADPNVPRHFLTVHAVGYRFLP